MTGLRVRAGDWLRGYQRSWLVPDVIAGLTVWALLVPEAMAYATVAGVPVQFGLYAVPLAVIGYALFGSSRQLFVGPSSTVAVLAASTVAPLAATGSDDYVVLIAVLSLMVGVLYVALGLLRCGFIARFFAKPVLDGFIAGLGIFIAVGQLHKVVGLPSHDGDTLRKFWDVVRHVGDWNWTTVAVGFGALALLFGLERISKRIPGAIVVVILGLLVSILADLADEGVSVVGTVPTGFDFVGWSGISYDDVVSMLPGALGIVVVGFAQSIAIAKALAARSGDDVDANAEMVGYGAANIGSGVLQGYPLTGSLSKTAAAREAGARSPIAYVCAAVLVVATVLFLAAVFEDLPDAVLGAIVIHAVSGMIDFSSLKRLWGAESMDFWLALAALVGVVVVGILPGLAVAVGLSLALFIHRLDHPRLARLGRRPDGSFADVAVRSDAAQVEGTVVLRLEAPLIFANADVVADAVKDTSQGTRRVVLDLEAVYEIDSQGADTLQSLAEFLRSRGSELVLARPHAAVRAALDRLGTTASGQRMYATVDDAVAAGEGNARESVDGAPG
jgi:high affinity sulfate transporter 1